MSLKSDLQAVLASLATGGAWDKIAAQGTIPPYIVWQIKAVQSSLALTIKRLLNIHSLHHLMIVTPLCSGLNHMPKN